MVLAEIAASMRTVAERLRGEDRAELRALAIRLTESDDARRAEARAGMPKKRGGGIHIAADGRVITKDTLFKAAA